MIAHRDSLAGDSRYPSGNKKPLAGFPARGE
jgi:hypothetical protein